MPTVAWPAYLLDSAICWYESRDLGRYAPQGAAIGLAVSMFLNIATVALAATLLGPFNIFKVHWTGLESLSLAGVLFVVNRAMVNARVRRHEIGGTRPQAPRWPALTYFALSGALFAALSSICLWLAWTKGGTEFL